MLTIQLHQLQFFAYHGLYEVEKINGNNFLMDIDICIGETGKIENINQTIDYVKVYDLISNRMKVPTPLLETLAQELAAGIYVLDNRIISITISIKKLTPPINNFLGTVGVLIKQTY